MDLHCEMFWEDNSVAVLGRYPTENYGSAAVKKAIIAQHRLISNIMSP